MVAISYDQEIFKVKACISVGGTSNNLQGSPRWNNETHFKEMLGCQCSLWHKWHNSEYEYIYIYILKKQQLELGMEQQTGSK